MLTAFLVIGGVGLALLVISLIVGEVHGALFDWIDNDLFSGAVVAAFLSALGFVGALVEGTSGNSTTATVAGVGAGIGMGYAARALTRSLQSGEGDTTVRSDALVGRQGHVVEAIPRDGMGMVSVRVAGHLTRLNARCEQPLPTGTGIQVTSVLSPTAVVVRPLVITPQDRVLS
ncbi:MAG: NfeD family protein [Actinomycetales bacterium]|nr:NfeD family protein [Candidatus Phosphoribacter baldrii]HRC12007.1 NfeD family protein [Dermatophilaceae bacterium]